MLLWLGLTPALAWGTDLAVTKTANPTTVQTGEQVTYTIVADNTSTTGGGPLDSPNTVVTDTLPSNLSFVSATSTQGTCSLNMTTVTCQLDTLLAGATATITVVAQANSAGTLVSNTAAISGALSDPDSGNNEASSVITITSASQADVHVTKAAPSDLNSQIPNSPGTRVPLGEPFNYTVTVTNFGPDTATGVTLTDTLPPSSDIDANDTKVTTSKGTCQVSGNTISCELGDLAENELVTLTIEVRPIRVTTARRLQTLTNSATATSSVTDPDPDDNTATSTVTVVRRSQYFGSNPGDDGDPVGTSNGEYYFQEVPDIELDGPLPIVFHRHYATLLAYSSHVNGSLGLNWSHVFEWKLVEETTALVKVLAFDGRRLPFSRSEDVFTHDVNSDLDYQLKLDGDNFLFLEPGTGLVYTFDAEGVLTRMEDTKGNALTLTYTNGNLQAVSNGLGRTLNFTYDTESRLVGVSDGTRSVVFTYDSRGLLVGVNDVLGNTTTFIYDTSRQVPALMTSKTLPRGNTPYTQVYNDDGQVVGQTDGLDNTTTFSYSEAPVEGQLTTTVTDPLGNTRVHVHDEGDRLVSMRNEASGETVISYDQNDARISATSPQGLTINQSTDTASKQLSNYALPDGSAINTSYSSRSYRGLTFWDLATATYPDGTSDTYAHDASGNLTTRTDRNGSVWTYAHDTRGQLTSMTNPQGGTVTMTYNTDGTRATLTDPAGNTQNSAYDALGRLETLTRGDGSTRTFTYDAADQVLTNSEGSRTITYTYDLNGNVASVTTGAGATTSFTHDSLDRMTGVTDPSGGAIVMTYDAVGRLANQRDRANALTTFGYDERGQLTQRTDPEGNAWAYAYDADGRLIRSTSPVGNSTNMTYDSRGLVSTLSTPLGLVTRFTYDSYSNLAQIENPGGDTVGFSYNARNDLTGIVMPTGVEGVFTVDTLGRTTVITDPNGNAWQRVYDSGGRLLRSEDPLNLQTVFTYDSRNRVAQMQLPTSETASFTYDAFGNTTGVNYSGGLSLSYGSRGEVVDSNGISATYDDEVRLTQVTLQSGKTVTYTYDARGLCTQVQDWTGGTTTLSYTADGQLAQVTRPNGVSTLYTYDADNRLTRIEENKGSVLASASFTRDANGNVTRVERSQPQVGVPVEAMPTRTYDAAHQITSFTYDAMGRVTADGQRTYSWDAASRLTAYVAGGNTVTVTHDGLGNLLTRSGGGTTTSMVWNYALDLPSISIVNVAGQPSVYYVHTPDGQLLHSIDAGTDTVRYYHFNEQGSTIALTDAVGTVIAGYDYSPYGQITAAVGNAVSSNLFTFVGQFGVVQESGTGLYHMRRRVYDSTTRRFLSRDPVLFLRDPKTFNPYQYAVGNPLRFVDPYGENPNTASNATTASDVVGGGSTIVSAGSFAVESAATGVDVAASLPGAVPKPPGGLAGQTLESARGLSANARAFGAAGNAREAGEALQRAGDMSETAQKASKVGRAANVAGNVATVAGVANALNDTNNNINEVTSRSAREQDRALRTFENNVNRLIWAIKNGTISTREAIRRSKRLKGLYEDTLDGIEDSAVSDIWAEGGQGLINSLKALLPVPTP
jgi:RHS repeat-associated protein/uncharacterized repeat protein (TIGR01451 family)